MVGMSGGVDSSVCAALLKEAGYNVSGVTLRLYDGEDYNAGQNPTCCSLSDVEDARAVCVRLGIPHYAFNFKESICKRTSYDDFINEYINGRTPNPCIECNRQIKFDKMLEPRQRWGTIKSPRGITRSLNKTKTADICFAAPRIYQRTRPMCFIP